jgi:hypothetical protein
VLSWCGRRFRRRYLKLIVEIELILEGVAKILVILNEENPAGCGHTVLRRCAQLADPPLLKRSSATFAMMRLRCWMKPAQAS